MLEIILIDGLLVRFRCFVINMQLQTQNVLVFDYTK